MCINLRYDLNEMCSQYALLYNGVGGGKVSHFSFPASSSRVRVASGQMAPVLLVFFFFSFPNSVMT